MTKTVRTRYAPSPTGYQHVGNIRTGFFAWLVARHFGGQFILRLEDTDKKREVAGADQHLIDCLNALGIDWDEGFDKGGPYAPYRQSERMKTGIYDEYAHRLLQAGRAYVDPYTPEQVQAFREQARANKQPFLYRNHRPENPSIQWDLGMTLRFKSETKSYEWQDEVMGDLHSGPEVIDDIILIKGDGYPTYNFAHIVDDAEMGVTHIIRGQEFIASTPNYLNIYEALGVERPILATMPHILAADGRKKLSKRDGAKDVLEYIREGYLPEALINFIASLGWNDGSTQEIFSRSELIAKFSLDRVQRSGARFDEQRLLWMNGHYIRELPLDELYAHGKSYLPAEAANYDEAYQKRVVGLAQERLKYLAELPDLTLFFFKDLPVNPALVSTHKQLKKLAATEVKTLLAQARETLEASDFSLDDLTTRLNQLLETTGQKPAVLFSLVRIATTQAPSSPGLADTLAVLGKVASLRRIDAMLQTL